MKGPRLLGVWKMGVVNYLEALKLQDDLASNRKIHKITDILLSLQHPPTYTLGKRRTDHNILVSESELKSMGADLYYTQRGGDVTFHGPHQAILYPIISLREIGLGAREYVGKLESTMIELASLHGVEARAGQKGETGVWVGQRKIGAIGVRISSGITSHGLAFNINPDMNYFKNIVPCGLADKEVTSLQNEVKQIRKVPRSLSGAIKVHIKVLDVRVYKLPVNEVNNLPIDKGNVDATASKSTLLFNIGSTSVTIMSFMLHNFVNHGKSFELSMDKKLASLEEISSSGEIRGKSEQEVVKKSEIQLKVKRERLDASTEMQQDFRKILLAEQKRCCIGGFSRS